MGSWRQFRWVALGGGAVVAFLLGFVGFHAYFDDIGVTKSSTDLAYLTLQLFVLESGSVPETGAPWQLEVARLAAPLMSATAVVAAIALVFREQWAEVRLRRQRDHVVVCGLGAYGSRLVRGLLDAGYPVVAIGRDPAAPAVTELTRYGATVITGDARDPSTLRRARLDRASHLVCLTGSDDTNAEIAIGADNVVAARRGSVLNCLAHIRDPDLCVLLRVDELESPHAGHLRLDFFSIDEQGARSMLKDHPPWGRSGPTADPPRVTVIGLNRLGQSLVAELARQWRATTESRGRPIAITVVDPAAQRVLDRLRRRFPQLDHAAVITATEADLDPIEADAVLPGDSDAVYVCGDDDSVALQAALRVRQVLPRPEALVVVELLHDRGLSKVIERSGGHGRVYSFDLLEQTLNADLLLGGTYEVLARAIHEAYLREQRGQGATTASNPSVVPWEELPMSLKESNRDQAAHIGTKLAAIGRGLAPLTDWDAHTTTFTDAEVERLAEMEHGRWVEQRRRDGWTSGSKDLDAKTTPFLVGWDSLSDDVKELDRQAIRGLPTFLARAGYQVVERRSS